MNEIYVIGSNKEVPDWLEPYMDDVIFHTENEWIMDRDYIGHEKIILKPWDILINTEEGLGIIFQFYSWASAKAQKFQSS